MSWTLRGRGDQGRAVGLASPVYSAADNVAEKSFRTDSVCLPAGEYEFTLTVDGAGLARSALLAHGGRLVEINGRARFSIPLPSP